MYRGNLRNEWVKVERRAYTDDGIGGSTSTYPVVVHERYFCRIFRAPVERDRRDQGNVEDTVWGFVGDNVDILEGDKLTDSNSRQFIVTKFWNDLDGRTRAQAEGRMRLISP